MKVVLLGTGGPRPDPRRNATTTLIRHGDENILFDAGRGVTVQLVKAGVPLAAVNPVFITHHHFDHIGDLYDVMLATWMAGRKDALRGMLRRYRDHMHDNTPVHEWPVD